MNLSKREIKVEKVSFSFYSFKNLPIGELPQLVDSIVIETDENQSVIVNSMVWGNQSFYKIWKNVFDEAFDEANWPLLWINRNDQKSELNGSFVVISQATVKTIISDDFVSKTFDTPFGRLVFGGNFAVNKNLPAEKQVDALLGNISKALLLSGMTLEHLTNLTQIVPQNFNQNLVIKDELNNGPISTITINPDAKNIAASITALIPAAGIEKLNQITSSNDGLFYQQFYSLKNRYVELGFCVDLEETNNINEAINDIFTKIEKQVFVENFGWNSIFSGMIYCSNQKIAKALKEILKEMKLPLSAFLIIENPLPEKTEGLNIHLIFIN